jgi:hypothetical protein
MLCTDLHVRASTKTYTLHVCLQPGIYLGTQSNIERYAPCISTVGDPGNLKADRSICAIHFAEFRIRLRFMHRRQHRTQT